MKILIFDTETNGLPQLSDLRKYYHGKNLKYYENSRLIEIGYKIFDFKSEQVFVEYNELVKPDGFLISEKISKIHGITHEKASSEGININRALDDFCRAIQFADVVLAYNVDFDINVVLSEAYRYNNRNLINALKSKITTGKINCVMKIAKEKLNLRNIKLEKLYNQFFPNEKYVQTHRAIEDVELTIKCFLKLMKNS